MWHLVTRGNIQQISYIPQTEQHSPFGLMLLRLGNVTIMCVFVCVLCVLCVCVLCVCVCCVCGTWVHVCIVKGIHSE